MVVAETSESIACPHYRMLKHERPDSAAIFSPKIAETISAEIFGSRQIQGWNREFSWVGQRRTIYLASVTSLPVGENSTVYWKRLNLKMFWGSW
jgi:hypothetical protein